MGTSVRTDRLSRWAQGLALLLVAVLGLQGMPLQSLIHSTQQATHHQCSHPKGFCPMSPSGPCTCDHDAPPSTDGPVFEGCNSPHSSAVQLTTRLMLVFNHRPHLPRRRSQRLTLVPRRPVLSSQRVGDDVFHPPRVETGLQPVPTRQVSTFA